MFKAGAKKPNCHSFVERVSLAHTWACHLDDTLASCISSSIGGDSHAWPHARCEFSLIRHRGWARAYNVHRPSVIKRSPCRCCFIMITFSRGRASRQGFHRFQQEIAIRTAPGAGNSLEQKPYAVSARTVSCSPVSHQISLAPSIPTHQTLESCEELEEKRYEFTKIVTSVHTGNLLYCWAP